MNLPCTAGNASVSGWCDAGHCYGSADITTTASAPFKITCDTVTGSKACTATIYGAVNVIFSNGPQLGSSSLFITTAVYRGPLTLALTQQNSGVGSPQRDTAVQAPVMHLSTLLEIRCTSFLEWSMILLYEIRADKIGNEWICERRSTLSQFRSFAPTGTWQRTLTDPVEVKGSIPSTDVFNISMA